MIDKVENIESDKIENMKNKAHQYLTNLIDNYEKIYIQNTINETPDQLRIRNEFIRDLIKLAEKYQNKYYELSKVNYLIAAILSMNYTKQTNELLLIICEIITED